MGDRNYYIAGVLIIILAMIPFFAGFESCRPEARELVTIAVMCAIAVASRIVFIMLPGFKPVVAIIMITGMAFGPVQPDSLQGLWALLSAISFSDRGRGLHGRCSPSA